MFEKYSNWSGQAINANKSSIHFSKNTLHSTASSILDILPFNHNAPRSIYLGLPLLFGNSKARAFNCILDKVHKEWRAGELRISLKRLGPSYQVSGSLHPYICHENFLLPKSFCSKLDRLFKNFWWGFPPNKAHNLCLKSWQSICLPKAWVA
ncbi:hypothetical protein SLA2020_390620 [Shorea laevis]